MPAPTSALPSVSDEQKAYVLSLAKKQDVKFVRLWFTDVLGFLKSVSITVEELGNTLERGQEFDGSSIEGFARIDESDMVMMPDPNTFCIIPWRPREGGSVARMFCDIVETDGTPHAGDSRWVLKRNVERAAELGYTFYVAPELEYYYFRDSNPPPQGLDEGGYFDLTPMDVASDLRRDTILTLESMGVGVESSHHEVSPSQHEIELRYTDASTMADNAMTYRLVVKEIAMKFGYHATFMPKPIYGQCGSGMHTNMSLFRGDKNAFYSGRDRHHLSNTARRFTAGLLRHAAEITLITNQWVNSYKRLVPGFEAPVYVSWAFRNRSDLIRVPTYKPGRENAMRIELRSPDPACNPYLAFAAMLAAGLAGIENEYEPPPAMEENLYAMTDAERQARNIEQLPENLCEAIRAAERSPLLRECLGDHVFEKYIENKKIEWETYRAQVTDYELKRYLPVL